MLAKLALVAALLPLPAPALAHHQAWRNLIDLRTERVAMIPESPDIWTWPREEPPPHVHTRRTYRAEQWRPLVERYFPPGDVDWALRVIWCESRGDPNASNGSHDGLMQQSRRYWPGRAAKAGWAGASPFDPEANLAVSAWLLRTGGRSHWTCR